MMVKSIMLPLYNFTIKNNTHAPKMNITKLAIQNNRITIVILVVVLLAGFIGRAIAPKASGIAYVKEH